MNGIRTSTRLLIAAATWLSAGTTWAADAIRLRVDATEAPAKLLKVQETIPVSAGPLTLFYPKWIQGVHAPVGPIKNMTGLKISTGGNSLPWKRDLLDVFTFHVDVPAGARQIEVAFEFLEAPGVADSAEGGAATAKLLDLNWYQVLFYPAGFPSTQIMVRPTLILPTGWNFGTPLHVESHSGAQVEFEAASLWRLVDSPVVAGEFFRSIDLTPEGEPIHHQIDIVADSAEALRMSPQVQRGLTNLVAESGRIFGARHYREYHFLLTLSDYTAHFGVEHHESNDSRLPERVLLSPGAAESVGGLLAHEFAHSWSGKFRRPKEMATQDFQTPMQTDLLWVYEGNTSYLGDLLATRSGLWTAEDYRQALAAYVARLGIGRPGRTWRPLVDTAAAIPGYFGGGGEGGGWVSWRRGADYYEEGELLWLEAATIICDQSHGQKTLDDFFKIFYGGTNDGAEVKPYTFDELVQMMNQVVRYDWARFWSERLTSTAADAPSRGVEASGWKTIFTEEPMRPGRAARGVSVTTYSIGLGLGSDGMVSDAAFGGPAFNAGLAPGMKVVGVNGRVYTPEVLEDAIRVSKDVERPITLLVVEHDYYKTCAVNYREGIRYPHLARDASKPDYLGELTRPTAK